MRECAKENQDRTDQRPDDRSDIKRREGDSEALFRRAEYFCLQVYMPVLAGWGKL